MLFFLVPSFGQAVYTELGLSHTYKKTSFNEDNFTESEFFTGSVSFYLWERVALETSYSKGRAIREEVDSSDPLGTVRRIHQDTTVLGLDLILAFADRKAVFQPFIKAGVAQIYKKQTVQDAGQPSYSIEPEDNPAIAPSKGIGFKLKLTESFVFTASLDSWTTPLDGKDAEDIGTRLGIAWML